MNPPGRTRPLVAWTVPRMWLFGTAFAFGLVLGWIGVPALGVLGGGGPTQAAETVFSIGALAFGFGTLGWAGSVMGGRGFEAMQAHLDTGTDWTEADSRRAMTRIAGFGGGLMVSAPLIATIL